MPIPATAIVFKETMDPADVLEWKIPLSRGPAGEEPTPFLYADEDVASFTLSPTTDAIAAGLIVKSGSGGYPAPTLVGLDLTFWTSIDAALQGAAMFAAGVDLALELTVTTSSTPPRRKQRTYVIKGINR